MSMAALAERHEPTTRPSVLIISLTEISDQPRVRRQAVSFARRGWAVHLAGFEGLSTLPREWNLVLLDKDRVYVPGKWKWLMPLAATSLGIADAIYWASPANIYMRERLGPFPCDLVIAHDYFTAPLAAEIAKANGAPYVVDCHEYARGQYPLADLKGWLRWRLFDRPYIDAIQRHYLSHARAVSTVCDGIADLLWSDYDLPQRPAVVRSVPEYEEHAFRPCGEKIRVLYHGLAVPSRGLEQAIDSVSGWRPEFMLSLRLMCADAYLNALKARVIQNGVEDRVEFLEPVPFTDLIGAAAEADIGYCVLENFSPQRRFTSPNKFFEYAMAGLAIVCSDLPELRKIGDRFGHCAFVSEPDPGLIAERINALTRETIDRMKQKSLEAARVLCWEREQETMITAYLGRDERNDMKAIK